MTSVMVARRMGLVLGLVVGGMGCLGQTQPARVTLTKEQIEGVTKRLQDGATTGEELDGLVKQIGGWVESGSSPSTELAKVWLPALYKRERFEDVAGLALRMVMVGPSTSNIRDFLPQRVFALQRLNRMEEALEAAKGLYNVSDAKNVDKAIAIVAQCLQLCHRDDPTVARKFVMEQAASKEAGAATQPAAVGEGVLKSVKIDGQMYEAALGVWKGKAEKNDGDAEKYGNLLLLADRGAEAEAVFRGIAAKAVRAGQKQRYMEGVGRAMKAQDGNLARMSAVEVKPADAGMP